MTKTGLLRQNSGNFKSADAWHLRIEEYEMVGLALVMGNSEYVECLLTAKGYVRAASPRPQRV